MATFWEIATRSVGHLFSLSLVHLYFLFISHFCFKSGIWLSIAPVPVHCFSITFNYILLNYMYFYIHNVQFYFSNDKIYDKTTTF